MKNISKTFQKKITHKYLFFSILILLFSISTFATQTQNQNYENLGTITQSSSGGGGDSGGGGSSSNIINNETGPFTSESQLICREGYKFKNNTCILIPEQPQKKSEIPKDLFDISFELNNYQFYNISELETTISFENFGTTPTEVEFILQIFKESGEKIYEHTQQTTVQTNQIFVDKLIPEKIKNINQGNYTIILTTKYGDGIIDKFTQKFQIIKEPPLQLYKLVIGILLILLILYIIQFIEQLNDFKTKILIKIKLFINKHKRLRKEPNYQIKIKTKEISGSEKIPKKENLNSEKSLSKEISKKTNKKKKLGLHKNRKKELNQIKTLTQKINKKLKKMETKKESKKLKYDKPIVSNKSDIIEKHKKENNTLIQELKDEIDKKKLKIRKR